MINKKSLTLIGITTGDSDGIGLEVTAKALPFFRKKSCLFILWRARKSKSVFLTLLKKSFNVKTFNTYTDADSFLKSLHNNELQALSKKQKPLLLDISSERPPAFWVLEVGSLCFNKKLQGMVTAPLSKTSIQNAGLNFMGHNEILKSISKTQTTFMGFVGKHFGVVLATGHIPISQVSKSLKIELLKKCLLETHKLHIQLNLRNPIKILGLNPHAGELGLIGNEEVLLFRQLQAFARSQKIKIEGPLVPDAAFLHKNWKQDYALYISLYHDQGLIPFKLVHGQNSGYQISLGLPFIRTSVDHGTAKDIFRDHIANPGSMRDSVGACLNLVTSKQL